MARSGTPPLMSSERTKAYTDAVFAIAATLLVLGLSADSIGQIQSDDEMWAALAKLWPDIFSFVLSFALLSLLWTIHLRQFHDIARVDGGLLWLNNVRLLFIVLVPFTTSLTDGYQDWYAGRMLLPINFFLAGLFGYLSWVWAARKGGILLVQDHDGDRQAQSHGGLAASICGGIAVALSPWIGSFAFLAYLLNAPLTALLSRPKAKPGAPSA